MISRDAPWVASMIRVDAEHGATRERGFDKARIALARWAAGAAAAAFCLTVAAMAAAQGTGGQRSGAAFKQAPKSVEAEAQGVDMILGIPANTIFFVAAGVIAIFWFTVGGGRRAKNLGRQQ